MVFLNRLNRIILQCLLMENNNHKQLKAYMRTSFVYFICLFLIAQMASAQTWSQRLSAAERDYEEGRLANIPARLEGGFLLDSKEGGYSKEERIRALKLITKVYIFIDDEPKAEENLIKLLKADKEHKLDRRVDPAELYFLYEQFRTKPIFRLALRTGMNKSYPQIMETFNTANSLTINKIYNGVGDPPGTATTAGTLGTGFWGELVGERHLRWGVEVGTGIGLRNSSYDVDNFVGESAGGDPTLISFVSNQQLNFRVPVFARYNLRYFEEFGPIPYFTIGASYDRLLDARYVEATRRGGTSVTLSSNTDLIATDQVNRNNLSGYLALGTKLRVKTHFLTLEFRYDRSFYNYINEDNRWNGNQAIAYDLAFVEDDLSLDMLSFSIGYTYSIYSPKKLKEFR